MRAPEARAKFFVYFAGSTNFDACCGQKMGATVAPISKKLGANPKRWGPLAPAYFHRCKQTNTGSEVSLWVFFGAHRGTRTYGESRLDLEMISPVRQSPRFCCRLHGQAPVVLGASRHPLAVDRQHQRHGRHASGATQHR